MPIRLTQEGTTGSVSGVRSFAMPAVTMAHAKVPHHGFRGQVLSSPMCERKTRLHSTRRGSVVNSWFHRKSGRVSDAECASVGSARNAVRAGGSAKPSVPPAGRGSPEPRPLSHRQRLSTLPPCAIPWAKESEPLCLSKPWVVALYGP